MKYRIKNTKTTIQIIGYYQIVGGITGILFTSNLLLKISKFNGPLLFIFLLAYFLFGFSIQSGNLILQNSKLKKGLIYSIILQSIQIVSIGIGNYCYDFYSGAQGTIGLRFGNGFHFGFVAAFSGFHFMINSSDAGYYLKINIVAIVILLILLDIYNEIKTSSKVKAEIEDNQNKILDSDIL